MKPKMEEMAEALHDEIPSRRERDNTVQFTVEFDDVSHGDMKEFLSYAMGATRSAGYGVAHVGWEDKKIMIRRFAEPDEIPDPHTDK